MSTFNPRSSWPQPSVRKLAPVGSSFVDEPSQMTVVVLENVSMVFHQPFEHSDDEFSKYEYSIDAPSYLCEKPSPRRLNSSDYAANHNISQYFRVEDKGEDDADANNNKNGEARDDQEDDFDDNTIEESSQLHDPTERPTLEKEDSILGSLTGLLPNKSAEEYEANDNQHEYIVDRKTYAAKLLGIEDEDECTTKTAMMDSSMNNHYNNNNTEPGYESPVQKKNGVKRWFKQQLGGGGKKDKDKKNKGMKKDKKRSKNPFRNSIKKTLQLSAPRKAPPKRSVSELRRASF